MTPRRTLGCLAAVLALCAWTGCKDKGSSGDLKLDQRCEQLGKACGDNDKHSDKIVEGCKQAAQKQAAKGCTDKALAVYDCFEKELCGKSERLWAFDDFRVLADRKGKCVAEQNAASECAGK